jgi:hypothetical protein
MSLLLLNTEGRRSASLDACFGAVGKAHQNNDPTKCFERNDYGLPDLNKEIVFPAKWLITRRSKDDGVKGLCRERRSTREQMTKSGYYDDLNETGLFGSICKHGVPLYFLNVLYGGEKNDFSIKDKWINTGILSKYCGKTQKWLILTLEHGIIWIERKGNSNSLI